MTINNPSTLLLNKLTDKEISEAEKEIALMSVQTDTLHLMMIVLHEEISTYLKKKFLSLCGLKIVIISEDNIKKIFQTKGVQPEVLDAFAMFMPHCFSGTLVNYLVSNKQISSLSENFLKNYIQNQ